MLPLDILLPVPISYNWSNIKVGTFCDWIIHDRRDIPEDTFHLLGCQHHKRRLSPRVVRLRGLTFPPSWAASSCKPHHTFALHFPYRSPETDLELAIRVKPYKLPKNYLQVNLIFIILNTYSRSGARDQCACCKDVGRMEMHGGIIL